MYIYIYVYVCNIVISTITLVSTIINQLGRTSLGHSLWLVEVSMGMSRLLYRGRGFPVDSYSFQIMNIHLHVEWYLMHETHFQMLVNRLNSGFPALIRIHHHSRNMSSKAGSYLQSCHSVSVFGQAESLADFFSFFLQRTIWPAWSSQPGPCLFHGKELNWVEPATMLEPAAVLLNEIAVDVGPKVLKEAEEICFTGTDMKETCVVLPPFWKSCDFQDETNHTCRKHELF